MKNLIPFLLFLLGICFPQAVQQPVNVIGTISAGGSTCATTNACIAINLPVGTSSVSANITGTFSGTLNFEQSGDFGLTWVAANAIGQPSGSPATSTTSTGLFIASAGGPTAFRVRGSSGWSSGSATITLTATPGITSAVGSTGTIAGTVQGVSPSNSATTSPIVAGANSFNTANGNPTSATSGNQVSALADQNGALFVRPEGGPNVFVCTVTLSSNTTTQCQAAPGSGLRVYITGFIINTTTAGTATTVQPIEGTGTNCGSSTANLSAIAYPNTSVGITSVEYPRVGLVPTAAEAVCFKQAGTTAGTSVVEAYGVIAP